MMRGEIFDQPIGRKHATVDIHRFPDGESRLALPPALPEAVLLFRSLHDPNAKLTELLIAAGGARALGARQLALVAPYLCYMRQDKAFVPGQPVSQRIIGALLAQHFEAVLTVDPHLHRVATLAEAVFPFYIIHQTIIVLVGYGLLLAGVAALPSFAVLLAATVIGCWLFYAIGRSIGWLRPLIGLQKR